MALRRILTKGDPALTRVCRPVTEFNEHLHTLLDDMQETLADANGLGLAAPQVGVLRRAVIVVDENERMIELVNPEIMETQGEQDGPEGCLSVPGVYGMVKRPMRVRVKAQDRYGNPFELVGEGMTARACCHETEHLDGHLFLERTDHVLSEQELQNYYARKRKTR